MKRITKVLSGALAAAMTATMLTTSAFAAGVSINATNFPDANFRSYVEQNIDKNGDKSLSDSEIGATKEIDVVDRGIKSLKGIEYFAKLTEIFCYNNALTSLDVSKNVDLETLYCHQNALTSLDLSKNSKLCYLLCSNNELTYLDVRNNENLQDLGCAFNQISSLDLSRNIMLRRLYCYNNQLTELDFSNNPELSVVDCRYNQLSRLSVAKNPELFSLAISENPITQIDLSKNKKLKVFECSNAKITSVDISMTQVIDFTFTVGENEYDIAVNSNGTFDLSTLPGGFDTKRASNWNGGNVSGSILTVNSGADRITYTYDCGRGCKAEFALNIKSIVSGDINGDGAITNGDLVSLARYVVQIDDTLPYMAAADLNKDGNITNSDLVALARKLVGLD